MSTLKRYSLLCDHVACRREFFGRTNELMGPIRTRAERQGWSTSGDKDYCPAHQRPSNPYTSIVLA